MLTWLAGRLKETTSFLMLLNMPGPCMNIMLSSLMQSSPDYAKLFFESSNISPTVVSFRDNNNERISRTPFHVKHAQLC